MNDALVVFIGVAALLMFITSTQGPALRYLLYIQAGCATVAMIVVLLQLGASR